MHDLRDEVDDQEMVDRFAADWRSAGLDPATIALLEYAELLTGDCAGAGPEHVAGLRSHGFDDRGVSSAVQVVAYFNYINRIAEGLGVAHEDWIDEGGRPMAPGREQAQD